MKVVLIDDEALANRRLEILLADYPDVEIVASVTSGREGVVAIADHRPDAVFMDVEMPELNGFQTLEAVDPAHLPIFVFVTAHADFAIQAFEREAIDYLMKPVERDRLKQCIERMRARLDEAMQAEDHKRVMRILRSHREETGADIWNAVESTVSQRSDETDSLRLQFGDKEQKVQFANIDWIEAERDYLRVYAGGRSALIRGTMSDMEGRLSDLSFMRVHRSAIVNMDKVSGRRRTGTGSIVIVLADGREVRVGRKYAAAVNRVFPAQVL